MSLVRKTMLFLGIWPVKTGDNREKIYELYFCLTFFYYILFTISGITMAYLTYADDYLTAATSMGIVIEYITNGYKVLILYEFLF